MSAEPCRVAIVEDDHRIRETVRQLIDRDPEFRCSGAYWTAEQGLAGLASSPADLLLLDIHLPGMSGTEAVKLFHQRYPNVRALMFTVFDDDARIFDSPCNGAAGYVLKKTPPAKLLDALRDARDGGAPMSSEIARRVVDLFKTFRPRDSATETLTATEVRLLAFLADGHSYQKSADAMHISINTVRDHVRSIYEKLQVHSKSAAVSKALRAGII
ncbi:MAG: response regulator [Thermoanaerobaculia bacterium]